MLALYMRSVSEDENDNDCSYIHLGSDNLVTYIMMSNNNQILHILYYKKFAACSHFTYSMS